MGAIQVRPLRDDLPFGARITGVTRETLTDEAVRHQILQVFEDTGVIVFEDVESTAAMQVAISNVFGPLKEHPVKLVERLDADTMPGVITIRNEPTAALVEIDGKPLVTWQPWHFDHTYNNELNRAGVLRAETIASEGGLTAFVDGVQIYDDLAPEVRAELETLTLIYSLDMRFSRQRFGLPKSFKVLREKDGAILDFAATLPRALHPAVWTRPTGEKVVHMTPYGCHGIEGDETPEGDRRLDRLWAEVEKVMKPYHHQWRPTDMLIWDNWRTLHEACGCDPSMDRVMHRTTIKGDYGFGRWEEGGVAPPATAAA